MNRNAITKKIHALLSAGDINASDIIYALSLAGHTQTSVSTKCGCTQQFVSGVINSNEKSFNVASYISSVLNVPLNRLWPGQYNYTPRPRSHHQHKAVA